ncbi:MAG TPA: phosphoenolpyruvate carboxykinase (GTP) [Anaerohalosphaeraceae bacterium]|nr:phosphoenolpyruvate carboxykinase (GTP) [Anaerohalosphaeraceae bacterium]HOL30470.1 phosphoenolpyruvate carboxykinase (GTP) [Anaerohalosphaeraceae bacterium]HPO69013.1 phosphoenolpyruvate carboxykinase (GTP) [Anaerohalosphaeraceae bacterium]
MVNTILESTIDPINLKKLTAVSNPKLHAFIAEAIELLKPSKVLVVTDSKEDLANLREMAKNGGGEIPLAIPGHTYHFDGPNDQGRDTFSTRYLLPKDMELGESLNSIDRQQGLDEIRGLLKNAMKGRTMIVCFWCLCPTGSDFAISCVQITDSPYVAHSESILYRPGYEQFKKLGPNDEFFRFMHLEGQTDENGCSIHWEKRRVYIDLIDNTVYSVNTQYAGNTVGLKKLALRLAIQKASKEGWLAEHMFIMGAKGPGGRTTYFAGAFPSACGKTSTAMLPGQTIIGDDIAYFRKRGGRVYAANVEQGIFGIIGDVNPDDDPVIFKALQSPGEVIFGNVLIADGKPYWEGMGCRLPERGINFQGQWYPGKKDGDGKEIPPSHKNARYTIRLDALANLDPELENPQGVPVGGIIYGGRDSDTLVPVEQAFNWTEGIIAKGASIESETTAATLGQHGVRKFNIMANQDFVSIPLGRYIQNNLDFAKGVKNPPAIFSVNYFLRDENNKFLNGKLDKMIWLLWAELRVNGDVDALQTPTGWIPRYEDLVPLFADKLGKKYTQDDYVKQFTVRVANLLDKFDRVEKIYRDKVPDTPQIVYDTFAAIRKRLQEARSRYGDFISPLAL